MDCTTYRSIACKTEIISLDFLAETLKSFADLKYLIFTQKKLSNCMCIPYSGINCPVVFKYQDKA